MKNNCIYFAEGKCEERLLNALKENPQKIQSGRVKVFNVIQELLPKSQLVTIQAGTTVVGLSLKTIKDGNHTSEQIHGMAGAASRQMVYGGRVMARKSRRTQNTAVINPAVPSVKIRKNETLLRTAA